MNRLTKKFLKKVANFACEQYVVLFFILALGIKLYFFNTFVTKVTWSQVEYTHGIVCGLLSAAVIFSPLYFIRKHKGKLAIILASLISLLIVIDAIYYSYFSSLPTMGILNTLGQTKDVGPAIGGLLNLWFLLFFADVALAIILKRPFQKIIDRKKEAHGLSRKSFSAAVVTTSISAIILFTYLSSFGLNNLSDALNKGYNTRVTSQSYGLLIAHSVDFIRFIEQETTHLSSEQEKNLADWVKNNKSIQTTDALTAIAKGKNVIMIQVESLGGFAINQTVNGKSVTPNLDKLAASSQFYPNDRFLYGGGHTSDTDFVANTSYFPLSDAAVFVRYGYDDFTSLPKTLVASGYSAYAYHGYNRNFWNRDVALNSLGYQKFYASNNYSDSWKLNMGLNDGDFLSETADYIKSQPKPSLSYVITLSSHVPFSTNEQTEELGINKSDYPDQVGGYLEDINYTDRMLGKFFDKLKSEGLYDDSLILVYGDHTPVLPAFTAGSITYDPDSAQQKEVPLIIKLPNATIGKTYAKTGTHMDIAPTVIDLLGIKTSQLMFGQSLFADDNDKLNTCVDQFVAFKTTGSCTDQLAEEKLKSAEIIRYNQFDKIK